MLELQARLREFRRTPGYVDALAAEPTVRSAGFADFFLSGYPIVYRPAADPDGQPRTAFGGVVSPGWFEETRATVLAGRIPVPTGRQMFEAAVNTAFAERAGLNATTVLGSRLRVRLFGEEQRVEIVGVVAGGPPAEDGRPASMLIYRPICEQSCVPSATRFR